MPKQDNRAPKEETTGPIRPRRLERGSKVGSNVLNQVESSFAQCSTEIQKLLERGKGGESCDEMAPQEMMLRLVSEQM